MQLSCNMTLPGCDPWNCTCDDQCGRNPENIEANHDLWVSIFAPGLVVYICSLMWALASAHARRKQGFTPANVLLTCNVVALVIRSMTVVLGFANLGTCEVGSEAINVIVTRVPQLLWLSCALTLVGVWHDLVKSARKLTRHTTAMTAASLKRRLCVLFAMLMLLNVPPLTLVVLDTEPLLMWNISNAVCGMYTIALVGSGLVYGKRMQNLLSDLHGRVKKDGMQSRRTRKGHVAVLHVRRCVRLITLAGFAMVVSVFYNIFFNADYKEHLYFYAQAVFEEGALSLIFTLSVSRPGAAFLCCDRRAGAAGATSRGSSETNTTEDTSMASISEEAPSTSFQDFRSGVASAVGSVTHGFRGIRSPSSADATPKPRRPISMQLSGNLKHTKKLEKHQSSKGVLKLTDSNAPSSLKESKQCSAERRV